MSQIEVWGTGKPLAGFTEDAILTSARKLFPSTNAQHIARFIAGKRFVITRVSSEAAAQKLIEGLAKSGIGADTAGPPPATESAELPLPEDSALSAEDAAHLLEDDVDDAEEIADAPEAPQAPSRPAWASNRNLIAGGVAALIVAAVIAVLTMGHKQESQELATQAEVEATTSAKLQAKFRAEADAKRQAERDAAAQATEAARQAEFQAKQDAAFEEINSAFVDGNYANAIALSDRYEQMYGSDPRVEKLGQTAAFNLQERARRGDFAAILDAPIKGSPRFEALRVWAVQAQERAKPVGGAAPLKPSASASSSKPPP